ncbi:hypothetical protein WN71_009255 [Streptomyces mangrovisoli]|uniref:HTH luxR-type domain-containing protein n=1 Tax=Streptomyces mangrovisoli TaxID=1428628 RepID=A0A1J4P0E4_9ACTN|nr:hypothetical protein WN71_009255 [Streptomyces mangrovisoli]
MLVGGPPGCADPSLMKAYARAAGAVLLDAPASPAETGIPLGVVGQLFQRAAGAGVSGAVDDGLPAVIRQEGARLAAATNDDAAGEGGEVGFAVLHRLHAALLRLSESAPVLVVVDEARHADEASLRFLLFLARRVREARVVVVLAESDAHTASASTAPAGFHAELLRLPHCAHLRLGALPPYAVAGALAEVLPPAQAEVLAADAHRISGGNPLLVRALALDHLAGRPGNAVPYGRDASYGDEVPYGDQVPYGQGSYGGHLSYGDEPLPHDDGSPSPSGDPVLAPGERFRLAVTGLLRRGDPAVLRLAQVLALAGADAPAAVLGRAAVLPAPAVSRALHALTEAGLLRGERFGHPEMARALREDLSAAETAELSRSVAHLLYEEGWPAATVARHLLAADTGPVGEAETAGWSGERVGWAAGVLREAAEEAGARHRHDLALRCLEAACALVPEERRAALEVRAADAAWHVRPAGVVRHLPRLLRAAQDGRLATGDTTAVAWHLLWHGRFEEVADLLTGCPGTDRRTADELAVLRLALATVGPEPQTVDHPAPRTPPGGTLAPTAPLTAGTTTPAPRRPPATPAGVTTSVPRRPTPTPAETATLTPPRPTGTPAATAVDPAPAEPRSQCLAVLDDVLRDRIGAAEAEVSAGQALERVRLGEGGAATAEPVLSALLALVYADRPRSADAWCERLLADPGVTAGPAWRARLEAVRAESALRRGDLPAARRLAGSALGLLPEPAWGVGAGLVLGAAVLAATHTGRLDEAAALLARPLPEAVLRSRYGLHYLHARGHHHLAAGRPYAAYADFAACGQPMTARGIDVPGLVPWRTGAAEASLRLGEDDRARRLAAEQLDRLAGPAGKDRARSRGLTLRVLAAASEPGCRVALLGEAVDLLDDDGGGDHLELARALAALSHALNRAGQLGRARMVARRAHRAAQECEAAGLSEELQAGKDDPRPAGPAASGGDTARLSDAELRVAALAAQGMTNREIAGRLFVTVSTVEQHLTQVYRKLNVRHRKELPYDLNTGLHEPA